MEQTQQAFKPDFSKLHDLNPLGYILRENLEQATFGMINGRSIATKESRGQVIKNKFKIGHKVVYPVKDIIDFLEQQYKPCKKEESIND